MSEMNIWNYDRFSNGQAPGGDSEVLMMPVRILPDLFHGGDSYVIVLCQILLPGSLVPPQPTAAKATLDKNPGLVPWFGIEQDSLRSVSQLLEELTTGAGFDFALGRPIADAHYKACLYAGFTISGINAEVMPRGASPEPMRLLPWTRLLHSSALRAFFL